MNLLIFLSDRCNMSCDYCFLHLNKGPASVLPLEAGLRAIQDHSRRPGAQFTFLGGEPFLHFPLLLELAQRARRLSPQASIRTVTNGTLLDSGKFSALRALGVEVAVSLDGQNAAHARHRCLRKDPLASALAETLGRIGPEERRSLDVSMVLCEDTAGLLLASVEFLRREGFRRLSFHLNLTQAWSEGGLGVLEKSLAGLKRYLRALPSGAGLELDRLESLARAQARDSWAPEHSYEDLVLGADGRYYPCDGLFSKPYAELSPWAVGDGESGVDWKAREAFHARARAFIHARLLGGRHGHCPREAYFQALAAGRDPDPAVRQFHRADAVFARALSEALCPA